MNTSTLLPTRETVIYPESDGLPLAENTKQLQYIIAIVCGLETLFRNNANVFVTGNVFWYPVEGDNTIHQAPDTMVVFGRPKGHRSSYRQWEEDGIAPQVVFEILSPGNRAGEMHEKWKFYQRYGVEEYYLYDPDHGTFRGWVREGDELVLILFIDGWFSPRLGLRFAVVDGELQLWSRDGQKVASFAELIQQEERTKVAEARAEQERQRAEQEKQRAEDEKQRAEDEKQRAEDEKQRAEDEKQRAEQFLARLKALGIDPEA